MPKTKPKEIKASKRERRRAGTTSPASRGPRTSSRRSSTSSPTRSASRRSARRSRRGSCCTARPGPARRCSPRRSRTSPAPTSSASRPPRSSRCSPASARPGSGACSGRPARTRPAILFIDELDAVGATRGSDISGERDQTLNQLLVEMDGFEASDNIVVMAASNLLEKLDPALLRPGRFDRQVLRSAARPARPRGDPRRPHPRQAARARTSTSRRVAQHTSGLTGADLANLCNEAAIQAGRSKREFIAQADFDNAFERVDRRAAEPQGDHRPREARRRLARGRPRARLRAAADRRQGPEGLDRARAARRSATRSTCPRRTAT